ncbi:MAG: plasmid stabilization protein [Desulfobulbaceae bacterium A2]|nr:MAG: plasmid stabilization protein [Desulfobulbaceae bacterium A2]
MSGVAFDPDARAEFLAAVEYYEESQLGLGRRFRTAVTRVLKGMETMPFRYRVLHAPFRRCLVPNFPYAIIFTIETDFILIVAVAHTKRKPGYWLDRMKK